MIKFAKLPYVDKLEKDEGDSQWDRKEGVEEDDRLGDSGDQGLESHPAFRDALLGCTEHAKCPRQKHDKEIKQ